MGYSVPVIHSLGTRTARSPPTSQHLAPAARERTRHSVTLMPRMRNSSGSHPTTPLRPLLVHKKAHARHKLAALGLLCRGAGPSGPRQPNAGVRTHPSTCSDGSPAGPCSLPTAVRMAPSSQNPSPLPPSRAHPPLPQCTEPKARNCFPGGARGQGRSRNAAIPCAHARGKGRCAHLCWEWGP